MKNLLLLIVQCLFNLKRYNEALSEALQMLIEDPKNENIQQIANDCVRCMNEEERDLNNGEYSTYFMLVKGKLHRVQL